MYVGNSLVRWKRWKINRILGQAPPIYASCQTWKHIFRSSPKMFRRCRSNLTRVSKSIIHVRITWLLCLNMICTILCNFPYQRLDSARHWRAVLSAPSGERDMNAVCCAQTTDANGKSNSFDCIHSHQSVTIIIKISNTRSIHMLIHACCFHRANMQSRV